MDRPGNPRGAVVAGIPVPDRWAAVIEAALDQLQGVWGQPNESGALPVSPSQLRALNIVATFGEINMGGLAERLGAIPSAASRLCDRMAAAGLLEREVSPVSRREVVLRLTPAGARLLTRLREERVQAVARVMGQMSPAEQRALVAGLLAFQDAAGEAAETADGDVAERA